MFTLPRSPLFNAVLAFTVALVYTQNYVLLFGLGLMLLGCWVAWRKMVELETRGHPHGSANGQSSVRTTADSPRNNGRASRNTINVVAKKNDVVSRTASTHRRRRVSGRRVTKTVAGRHRSR